MIVMYTYIHIAAFCMFMAFASQAQEQWRFHLAFEDATGARDTIWMIFDTSASVTSVDYDLGEGAIDTIPEVFSTWTYNIEGDLTRSRAFPYSYFPNFDIEIFANNYQFPVILSWDTSLFTAPGLPPPGYVNGAQMDCGHFFSHNNVPFGHVFNMLTTDSVSVELFSENDWLFPLIVVFGIPLSVGVDDVPAGHGPALHPNPTSDRVWISGAKEASLVTIYDTSGRRVMDIIATPPDRPLDVSQLDPGTYIVVIQDREGPVVSKFIKE